MAGNRTPPPAAKPSGQWRGVAHRNLRQEWRGTNHTTHQLQPHHTPPPPADPSQEWRGTAPGALSQEWRGPPTTTGSETQPGVAGSSTQEPPPGVARDKPHHTPATTQPTHHRRTPHTTHNAPHTTHHTPLPTAKPQPGVQWVHKCRRYSYLFCFQIYCRVCIFLIIWAAEWPAKFADGKCQMAAAHRDYCT